LGSCSRDPIGYGGGLNLFRYVDDRPLAGLDPYGLQTFGDPPPGYGSPTGGLSGVFWPVPDYFGWYYYGFGGVVDIKDTGLFKLWLPFITPQLNQVLNLRVGDYVSGKIGCENSGSPVATTIDDDIPLFTNPETRISYPMISVGSAGGMTSVLTVMGNSLVNVSGSCTSTVNCVKCCDGSCELSMSVRDKFQNPLDFAGFFGKTDWPGATPYGLHADWTFQYSFDESYETCDD
jgi:hypothetical protein